MTERKNHKSLRDDQMLIEPKKPSLTSCIRYHECGHVVTAFKLNTKIHYIGALGRDERMRLPNRQWSLNLGECGIKWFGDYSRMTYPVTDQAEEVAIIKDAAILFGGIMAHMKYAGISFERAAEMGGGADLSMVDYVMSFLPEEKRQGAISAAKSVCRKEMVKSKRGWAMVHILAEHLKEDGVLDAGDVGHILVVAHMHWELLVPVHT